MTTFVYRIHPGIFAAHPEYRRGVVVFRGLDNAHSAPEVTRQLRASEADFRTRVIGNPAEYPAIAAWRAAYRQFGARPSEHRSSIEALGRRVLKPDALPNINPLVDIGNLISLRHVLPAGVHPITERSRDVELRPAAPGDSFLADPGAAPEEVPANEIVLAAGRRVLTRRWTWRQAADTRTLAHSDCVFFDIDGLPPIGAAEVRAASAELIRLVLAQCGGECLGEALLDVRQPSLSIGLD